MGRNPLFNKPFPLPALPSGLGLVLSVVFLTIAGMYPIFKQYLYAPNQYSYAYGGDCMVLYYDLIYHVRHDSSAMLDGMNYPFGEYIFLTDAQGALSELLRWLNQNVVSIEGYELGIIHAVNLYLLPVCSLLVFGILRTLGVRAWLSVPFSVLITLLSPQVFRLRGHFGLAYPFIIPLAMLWLIRKYRMGGRLEKRDLLVLATLVFFTYNNPYIGFGAAGMLMAAGGILLLCALAKRGMSDHSGEESLERKKKIFFPFSLQEVFFGKPKVSQKTKLRCTALTISAMGWLAMLIPFLDFYLNDPVPDRLQQQWGFFYYSASFEGTFHPPGSFFHYILTLLKVKIRDMELESWMNVGLAATLLLLILVLSGIAQCFKKQADRPQPLLPAEMKILLGGSLLMYLYASSANVFPWAVEWMEAHLGKLLMFKASGRVAWSFYFAATIAAVVFLERWLRQIRRPALAVALGAAFALLWAWEVKAYMGEKIKDCFHVNHFHPEQERELAEQLKKVGFDTSQYQAILVLPRLMAWSDHFISPQNWAALYYSLRLSAFTGLPMLNAMLSRIGNGHVAEGIQLTSNPLVVKERLRKLPNRKDILLLRGSADPPLQLDIGEQHWMDLSTPLGLPYTDFTLHRVKLDDFERYVEIEAAKATFAERGISPNHAYLRQGFEGQESPLSFYGQGALLGKKGLTTLLEADLPLPMDTQYVFSAWSHIDNKKPGMGEWWVSVTDAKGQVLSKEKTRTREGSDIQGPWLRSELTFFAPKGARVKVELASNKEIYVDELLVRPKGVDLMVDEPGSREFLFNGYKVRKQQ